MKLILKKIFRYKLSAVCMLIGFCTAYLCFWGGNKVSYILNQEEIDRQVSAFRYRQGVVLTIIEDEDVILDFINEKCNATIINLTTWYDSEKVERLMDVVIHQAEESKYHIVSGRFPNTEELKSGERVVVLGRRHKANTYKRGNEEYTIIDGEEYKVTGYIKAEKSVIYDYKVLLFYPCIGENIRNYIMNIAKTMGIGIYLESEHHNVSQTFMEINRSLARRCYIMKEDGIEPFEATEISTINYGRNLYLVYVYCIITVVIIMQLWLLERKKEISIRRAYGYTRIDIIKVLIIDLFRLIFISTVICIVIQIIIESIVRDGNWELQHIILQMGVALLYILITGMVVSVYPVYMIMKRQVISLIK